MGRDNSPKIRLQRKLERKENNRANYDRILIVSEGSKTEPLYFEEIRAYYHLRSANIQVYHSQLGTEPIQVVKYAQQLFEKGDRHLGIYPKSFEQIYAVFDRDEHRTYFDALSLAQTLNDKGVRNDEKKPVSFKAIASVPCFELWLLLHYEEISAPITRFEVERRLKRYIDNYEKGKNDVFKITRQNLPKAINQAHLLAERSNPYDGQEPYTGIDILINLFLNLNKK